jgi:polyisoprenoid-binding protein YceI
MNRIHLHAPCIYLALALLFLGGIFAPLAYATDYKIDPDHSSVILHATHLGIGTVEGRFEAFSGGFSYDPKDPAACKVMVKIETASINTNQAFRDQHLRSADFLNVKKYPEITFSSTEVAKADADNLKITGDLTLHGVTHPVTLLARLGGVAQDLEGKKRIAFSATTEINRKDFGMNWNQVVGSTMVVGQMIEITLSIEGVE